MYRPYIIRVFRENNVTFVASETIGGEMQLRCIQCILR